jgi:hypothetical protein
MAAGYVSLLNGTLHDFWMDTIRPFMDSIQGSHLLWPGVAVVAVGLYFLVKK